MYFQQIGQIQHLTRYPVKSMAGIEMKQSSLGWHGLAGDRRFAIRQVGSSSGFPWLTASQMPKLLLYRPCDFDETTKHLLPRRVETPFGDLLEIDSDKLRQEIEKQVDCKVELMALKHGVFDDSPVSVIASSTMSHLCEKANVPAERRRFRGNIVVDLNEPQAFAEEDWVGRVLAFGNEEISPAIHVTKPNLRCKMIGLDPDTANNEPAVLKVTGDLNQTNAGIYGTTIRTGRIGVGDPVFLLSDQR